MGRASIPQLLRHILLAISFKWDVRKLIYLKSVLQTSTHYETEVTIHIITDQATNLRHVLGLWEVTATVHQSHQEESDTNKYSMLWEHREVIEEAAKSGVYTAFLYIEDDTGITWPSLVSWALDQQHLEPLGFSRGFYRTEISPTDGKAVLLDVHHSMDLATYNRTLRLQHSQNHCLAISHLGTAATRSVCTNIHFIQLNQPFMGMWMASHTSLLKWMHHPYWDKKNAVEAEMPAGLPWLGYPERSNGMLMFIDIPEGFQATSLVPYDPVKGVLIPDARVQHERNGYSVEKDQILGKLKEDDVFSTIV